MIYHFQTDTGNVRVHNEDSGGVFSNGESTLLIIADGMGGHKGGAKASSMAVEHISSSWKMLKSPIGSADVESWMETIIDIVNSQIYHHSLEHSDLEGMGTTVVFAYCTDRFVTIGHIGDSRGYLLNENGFTQLTEDHTYLNFLIKSGELDPNDKLQLDLHPNKHVLIRALGNESKVKPDVKTITFNEGETILLCSDGLHGLVSDELIKGVIDNDWRLEEQSNKLIELAKISGGSDNISVAIIKNTTPELEE